MFVSLPTGRQINHLCHVANHLRLLFINVESEAKCLLFVYVCVYHKGSEGPGGTYGSCTFNSDMDSLLQITSPSVEFACARLQHDHKSGSCFFVYKH